MLEIIKTLDKEVFLAINGAHTGFLDFVMFWASERMIWAPFYAFLIYLLFLHYKKQAWLLVLMAILLVAITDQTSVHFFKEVIHRLRPCHEATLADLVRMPYGHCGGQYGFISSHASNSFALAIFVGYFLSRKIKRFLLVMLIWAALICYSRIYMGVHYPLDVLFGAAWGSLLATGMIVWSRNLTRSFSV
jgi:undecaprenyl-diphosphatase